LFHLTSSVGSTDKEGADRRGRFRRCWALISEYSRVDKRFRVLTAAAIAAVAASCRSDRTQSRLPAPGPYQLAAPHTAQPRPTAAPPRAQPLPQPSPPRQAWGGPQWYPQGRPISPRWTTIVIHHSATDRGSASLFDRDHKGRGWDELGYHFVIGNGHGSGDGQIEVGARWHAQKHGAHCKTPDNYFNEHGIGICLVGDFTKVRPTPRQMASLQQLVGFLSNRCGIRPERVTTHGAVTGRTACPGRLFPLQSVRRTLLASSRP